MRSSLGPSVGNMSAMMPAVRGMRSMIAMPCMPTTVSVERTWTARRRNEAAHRTKIGRELAPHVRAPNLGSIAASREKALVDAGEVTQNVFRVSEEKSFGATVVGGRNDLRKIDDRRSLRAPQHVVGRKIPVD